MASTAAQNMTPRMNEMEQLLRSLPPDQLSHLIGKVSPQSSPSRTLTIGSSMQPTVYSTGSGGVPMQPPHVAVMAGGGNSTSPPKRQAHHLRHAASTMYTERQQVDVSGAQQQFYESAERNGLKSQAVSAADDTVWQSSYASTMTGKDALDHFMNDKDQEAAAAMEGHWGSHANKRKIDSGQVDNVEKALRQKIEVFSGYRNNPLQTLAKIFIDFDANRSGFMSEDEFVEAIALKLNFGEFQNELRALFKRYDLDSSGELSNEEFCNALFMRGDDARKTVGKIREVLALRAGGFAVLKGMGRQFRILDKDKSGSLNKTEMHRGLNMLCRAYRLHMEQPEADRLFALFDYNGDGQVNYNEFVRCLRGSMNKRRKDLVMMAFDTFEKDQWGKVTLRTIGSCYDVSMHPDVMSGKVSPTEALYEFMKKWDKDGDHSVTGDEFIDYYEWVSASIDNDDYFELMIRNAWHISGGTGWMANTTCRRVLVEHNDGRQEIVEIKNDIGVGKDPEKIKLALLRQGVQDIKFIKLTA